MKRPTKMQERELFIAEFVRRLREAPPGMRVYMRVGDVFQDAEVIDLDERRATQLAVMAPKDDDAK
jgi:putative hemolysin